LAGLAGVVIVMIDRRLTRRLHPRSNSALTAIAVFGTALVALLAVSAGGEDPFLTVELAALAAVAIPIWVAESKGTAPHRLLVPSATVVAATVVAVEWVRLVSSAVTILG
jgi:hypothetical protein